jgi:hypothetical protein
MSEMKHWLEKIYNNPEIKTEIGKEAMATIRKMGTFEMVLESILNNLKIELS